MLNVSLFGTTAREWQAMNPGLTRQPVRHATAEQLLVLANLENLNVHLIREGLAQ